MNFGKPRGFNKKGSESRRTNRYPIEADVTIVCDAFRTSVKSVDVSAGGLSLKANLPQELVGKSLQVSLKYVTSTKSVLKAEATCTIAPKTLNRLVLVDPSAEFQNFLDEIWS